MNKSIVRVGLFGLIAAAAMGLGGCNNNLKEENQALREDKAKLEGENTKLTQQLSQSETARNEAEGRVASKDGELNTLRTQMAAQPPAGGNYPTNDTNTRTKRNTREEDVTLVVAGDVLFSPGSATLTAGGKKEIDKVISTIKGKYGGHNIRVEGYTDSDPIKKANFPSNKALSQARADAVEKYMSSKGISGSRISAVGMGSEKPKSSKAASRRVEIVVVGNGN